MQNANKLGYYLWKRINQDQENYRKTRPPNIRGLYFNRSDLDSYIKDYFNYGWDWDCLLYTSPSPRDKRQSRMPSSA